MQEKIKQSLIQSLPVIVLFSVLMIAFIIYAWTEPSQAPPQENVPAPINVGTSTQYKAGALGIGGVLRGYSNAYFDGNVGIGTTNPSYKLDIVGALRLQPTSQPPGANGVIYYDSATNKFRCYQNGTWVDCFGSGGGFWASSGNNIYNTNSGNVGIGTSNPAYKLDVVGEIRATGAIRTNTGTPIYKIPWYCEGGGSLTTETTCLTACCFFYETCYAYYDCQGKCWEYYATRPSKCPTILLGRLLSSY